MSVENNKLGYCFFSLRKNAQVEIVNQLAGISSISASSSGGWVQSGLLACSLYMSTEVFS